MVTEPWLVPHPPADRSTAAMAAMSLAADEDQNVRVAGMAPPAEVVRGEVNINK
jgi:hypothetical protein